MEEEVEVMEEYKHLNVNMDNWLGWTHNSEAVFKNVQRRLYLLRKL